MKKLLLLLALPALLVSCSTDFDTTADYKEVMVVYGLLNQYDSVQYIKVNKAFLGDGNALIMAENSDSINYGDILDVTLEKIDNGTFGTCDDCGEKISIKRLEARPETTLCIRCKEDQERVEKDFT